jgi:uncharacterized protein (DUF4415 family)
MAKRLGNKKLNKTQSTFLPAVTRSPNGAPRKQVAIRFSMEELEALDAMAEKWQVTFSEAVREAVREKLAEEKILLRA